MAKQTNKFNNDNAIPAGLVVAVVLLVAIAALIWGMVVLQRSGFRGPTPIGVANSPNGPWSVELHEQFRAECAATLVGNLPPLPDPDRVGADTRADYERLKLWLAGACNCIHYRIADQVSFDDAKLVLFGNNLNRAHPQYDLVMENWKICLESNKDLMAPASPDMQDFRGGVAAE